MSDAWVECLEIYFDVNMQNQHRYLIDHASMNNSN